MSMFLPSNEIKFLIEKQQLEGMLKRKEINDLEYRELLKLSALRLKIKLKALYE